jgi:hypothetical protein
MRPPPTRLNPSSIAAPEPAALSIAEKFLAFLRSGPLANGTVALAITVGFFHGWLKTHYPHPAVTFAFDGMLILALIAVFIQKSGRDSFIPPGPVGNALKALYLVCILYLIVPFDPPLLVSLAALRGWCFATLTFGLGYHMTRSITQVKSYFYILIVLGVVVSIYGMRQTPDEIKRLMESDPDYAQRYITSFYASKEGAGQMRVFSTFVSAAAFGSTVANVVIFAVALMSAAETSRREKRLIMLAILPMVYGMVLSGSRTSLITLGVGLALIAWYRRNVINFIIVPVAIAVALKIAAAATSGAAAERFAEVLKLEDVFYRNWIPFEIGLNFMADNPFGGGLGKSGYSIPFFLSRRVGYRDFVQADGDIGRLMVDMGIVGLIVFGWLLFVGVRTCFRHLKLLHDTPLGTIALPSAACFFMSVIGFPSGSPFLGIPLGVMTWFFLGTLQKLADDHDKGLFAPPPALASDATSAPAIAAPQKKFLYYQPPKNQPPAR